MYMIWKRGSGKYNRVFVYNQVLEGNLGKTEPGLLYKMFSAVTWACFLSSSFKLGHVWQYWLSTLFSIYHTWIYVHFNPWVSQQVFLMHLTVPTWTRFSNSFCVPDPTALVYALWFGDWPHPQWSLSLLVLSDKVYWLSHPINKYVCPACESQELPYFPVTGQFNFILHSWI